MKKRLFVAIPLPKYLRDIFVEYSARYNMAGLRWTVPQNLHITVYFLGYIDGVAVPKIVKKLEGALSATESFVLGLEKICLAPPHSTPRMIWATFFDRGEYKKLSDAVYNALGEFSGMDYRNKESIPHITLARFRYPAVAKELTLRQPDIESGAVKVSSCDLMESRLSPHGPTYEIVKSFRLAE